MTFDLTPVKARAQILDKRDLPKPQPAQENPVDKAPEPKPTTKKPAAQKKILPRSQGDPEAYWITKKPNSSLAPKSKPRPINIGMRGGATRQWRRQLRAQQLQSRA